MGTGRWVGIICTFLLNKRSLTRLRHWHLSSGFLISMQPPANATLCVEHLLRARCYPTLWISKVNHRHIGKFGQHSITKVAFVLNNKVTCEFLTKLLNQLYNSVQLFSFTSLSQSTCAKHTQCWALIQCSHVSENTKLTWWWLNILISRSICWNSDSIDMGSLGSYLFNNGPRWAMQVP